MFQLRNLLGLNVTVEMVNRYCGSVSAYFREVIQQWSHSENGGFLVSRLEYQIGRVNNHRFRFQGVQPFAELGSIRIAGSYSEPHVGRQVEVVGFVQAFGFQDSPASI